jgi:hypothetical protein
VLAAGAKATAGYGGGARYGAGCGRKGGEKIKKLKSSGLVVEMMVPPEVAILAFLGTPMRLSLL